MFEKRLFDLALSAVAVVILAIITPVLMILIPIDNKGPVFFSCKRLGRLGEQLTIWKFRSMVHKAPDRFNADGSRLVEGKDVRVTRVGRLLRGGLDELPQVALVFSGKLSFVGPRPDDVFALDMYEGVEWLKLSATPGLTGLAQVTGRNEIPYKDRLKYDVYYALNQNLILDIRIAFRTFLKILGQHPSSPLVSWERVVAVSQSEETRAAAEAFRQGLLVQPRT
jgi:undecaprenyl phosphate N,N'-diacetylbacillosamine 1-phosphate transferase